MLLSLLVAVKPEILAEAGLRSYLPVVGKMIIHLVRLNISGGTIKISNIETHMKLFKIMVVLLLSIHGLVHSLTTLVLSYLDPTNTSDRPSEVTLHVL